jgi:hypothetical protein
MPQVTWIVETTRRRHVITFDYGRWSGSRSLTVDGVTVTWHDEVPGLWSKRAFDIGASRFLLTMRPVRWRPWSVLVELHNAGRVIPPSSVMR